MSSYLNAHVLLAGTFSTGAAKALQAPPRPPPALPEGSRQLALNKLAKAATVSQQATQASGLLPAAQPMPLFRSPAEASQQLRNTSNSSIRNASEGAFLAAVGAARARQASKWGQPQALPGAASRRLVAPVTGGWPPAGNASATCEAAAQAQLGVAGEPAAAAQLQHRGVSNMQLQQQLPQGPYANGMDQHVGLGSACALEGHGAKQISLKGPTVGARAMWQAASGHASPPDRPLQAVPAMQQGALQQQQGEEHHPLQARGQQPMAAEQGVFEGVCDMDATGSHGILARRLQHGRVDQPPQFGQFQLGQPAPAPAAAVPAPADSACSAMCPPAAGGDSGEQAAAEGDGGWEPHAEEAEAGQWADQSVDLFESAFDFLR